MTRSKRGRIAVAGRECHYCGGPADTRDHIVPVSRGGTYAQINLVPSCKRCNESKADDWPTCNCEYCQYAIAYFGELIARESKG
jgi:5-methylcytosine-specific restriction endonuclease McrA